MRWPPKDSKVLWEPLRARVAARARRLHHSTLTQKMQARQLHCDVEAAAAHFGCAAWDQSVAPVVAAALARQQSSFSPVAVVNWGQPSKRAEEKPGADLVRIFRRPFDVRTLPTEWLPGKACRHKVRPASGCAANLGLWPPRRRNLKARVPNPSPRAMQRRRAFP